MYVEQETVGDVITKLKIQGTEEELRALALRILDAIDEGKASCAVKGGGTLKIRIVKSD